MTATAQVLVADAEMRDDVLATLSQIPRTLSCRWLYDDRGSELFEEITHLPEYYPTRTELAILEAHLAEIAAFIGAGTPIIEYGAGSGRKSELLIEAVAPSRYIPIDIAEDFLGLTAGRIAARFPGTRVEPFVADFTQPFAHDFAPAERRAGFFPGSTLGNLDREQAGAFLSRMREHTGQGGCAVIGIDLVKPLGTLLPAYDDAQGVTAAFNLNLLERLNRELGASFDTGAFFHEARWNEREQAVEMHLVSQREQRVTVAGHSFLFAAGETIHTESSRKFTLEGFAELAAHAGWSIGQTWRDPLERFALVGLVPAA